MTDKEPPNLADVIEKMAKGSDVIVAGPGALDDLKDAGVEFDPPTELPPEETLDRLFKTRRRAASVLIPHLPEIPQHIQPNLGFLWNEIIECAIFGLHGAAVTLLGILVEFALKQATYKAELGKWAYDAEKWDEFESMTFHPAVLRARKAGIISEHLREELLRFKDEVRNPYSHYNIKKITAQTTAGKVRVIDTRTGESTVRNIPVGDEPALHAHAKKLVDTHQLLRALPFAAGLIEHLFGGAPSESA